MAQDTITIGGPSSQGLQTGLFSNASAGTGRAGTLFVAAPHLALVGGRIQVTSEAAAQGDAGAIQIEVGTLRLTEGAQINSSTSSSGQGGNLTVMAQDTITIGGPSSQGPLSGLFAIAAQDSSGNAGVLRVEARTLTLTGSAQISSSTFGPGQGGTVTVTTADTLIITGNSSSIRTSTASSGLGGDIAIQTQQARLTEGAVISAESSGVGIAGSITITARDTFLSQHSTVTTNSSETKGGNILVTTQAMVRLQDSQITATVGGGAGDGGNVTIDPDFIILQGSQITANAFAGMGGRIFLTATKAFLADPSSVVTASSTLGINGQVAIQAPVTSISGAVAPLPRAFAQTTELLRTRCAERLREGTVSRLVVGGRDGVPLEPGSLLPSPLEQVGQERGVHAGERQSNPPEAQPRWAWYAQAPTPGALAVECTQWGGKPGTTGTPKRRR
jgi:large exoprotein involved in heme utilization and adhesion